LENLVERSVILTRGKSLDVPLMEMRKLSGEGHDRERKDLRQEEIAEIVRSTLQALTGKHGGPAIRARRWPMAVRRKARNARRNSGKRLCERSR
jgi:hypothetical protein